MTGAPIASWLAGPLPDDVSAALARLADSDDVARVAVMPDVHLAHDVCVGTVVGTRRLLYPDAVGGDAGCGMLALRFDVAAESVDERAAARILGGLYRGVPGLCHPSRAAAPLPPQLEDTPLSHPRLERLKRREARTELGTLGRGNHFLELQSDEEGALWLMLHSGSRAVGPAVREHHLAGATAGAVGLCHLTADSDAGRAYLADLDWALAYAAANRCAMADVAIAILGDVLGATPDESSRIVCQHNHVRREEHEGEQLWVHRKGAISAAAGEPGVIPGSMGSSSHHVEGRGCEAALGSASHGAGRALSRALARREISARELARQMGRVYYDHRATAELRDEAPAAYKDIHAVMRAQRDLVRILRTLRPLLSYKATHP